LNHRLALAPELPLCSNHADHDHRFSRTLIIGKRTLKPTVEVSKATGAVYEGTVFEHGETIQSIMAAPGDDAEVMKRRLLDEACTLARPADQTAVAGEWVYEALNMDGSPAVR